MLHEFEACSLSLAVEYSIEWVITLLFWSFGQFPFGGIVMNGVALSILMHVFR